MRNAISMALATLLLAGSAAAEGGAQDGSSGAGGSRERFEHTLALQRATAQLLAEKQQAVRAELLEGTRTAAPAMAPSVAAHAPQPPAQAAREKIAER